jgi:hypothetical protein
MSALNQAIFVAGLLVSGLCLAFVYRTFVELRRIDAAAERRATMLRAQRTGSSLDEEEERT